MTSNHEYPRMLGEVLDAVHEMYVDYPDVEANCYLYLRNVLDNRWDRQVCANKLDNMERCSECGTPLETYSYNETHYEVDPPVKETFTELICPNCLGLNNLTFKDCLK